MPNPIYTNPTQTSLGQMDRLKHSMDKLSQLQSNNGAIQPYEDMSGTSAAAYITAEADLGSLDTVKINATLLKQTNNIMSAKLEDARSINQRLQEFLMTVRSPTPPDAGTFSSTVNQFVTELKEVLNYRFLGNAVFGGIATNNDPVNNSAITGLASNTDVETDYYQGGSGNIQIQVDDSRTIDKFPITAADPCFAKTLTALRILMNVTNPSSTDAGVAAAYNLVDSAKNNDYPDAMNKVGMVGNTLNSVLEENLDIAVTKQEIIAKGNPDPIETLMKLKIQGSVWDMSASLIIEQLRGIKELITRF